MYADLFFASSCTHSDTRLMQSQIPKAMHALGYSPTKLSQRQQVHQVSVLVQRHHDLRAATVLQVHDFCPFYYLFIIYAVCEHMHVVMRAQVSARLVCGHVLTSISTICISGERAGVVMGGAAGKGEQ